MAKAKRARFVEAREEEAPERGLQRLSGLITGRSWKELKELMDYDNLDSSYYQT